MVRATLVRAGTIARAVLDAHCAPLLADVEGQCLGVLRDVGRDVVFADTAVCEGRGVAVVFEGREGGYARLLGAD